MADDSSKTDSDTSERELTERLDDVLSAAAR
jgi:hypothetical protein